MILPENHVQKLSGIVINNVVAFKSNVNIITEIDNDVITTTARFETPRVVPSAVPITTGNNGSMHGARIVNTPAKIEIRKNNIILLEQLSLRALDFHSTY